MILSVDFGRKRTGTAILDNQVRIPFPHKLIEETNARKIKRALMDIIELENIDTVIFGLPLSDKGLESEWCSEIRKFAEWLGKSVKSEIIFVDEYGTSKEADAILRGKSRKTKKKSSDLIAATLILETYIRLQERENNNKIQ